MKKFSDSGLFNARVYQKGSSNAQPFSIGVENGDVVLADHDGNEVDRLQLDDWNLSLGGTNNERVVLKDDVRGHTILADIGLLNSLAAGCNSAHITNAAKKLKSGSFGRSVSKQSGTIAIVCLVLFFFGWVGIGFMQMIKDAPSSKDSSSRPVQETETREAPAETDGQRYMRLVEAVIKAQWKPALNKQANLTNLVKFQVSREGKISNIKVAKSSGDKAFDAIGVATLKKLKKLPPLPDSLEAPAAVEFGFHYNGHKSAARQDDEQRQDEEQPEQDGQEKQEQQESSQ